MKEIHYLLGNSCNLNCDFCFWDMRIPDVSLEQKKEIVDQIVKSGIKIVTISGGEPLCTNNFLEIIKYMAENELEIILHTNGLKITKEIAEKIAPLISRISLTLDGSNKDIIMRMRKNEKIISHTIFLINFFHKLGTPVNVKTLVTKVNKDDVLNIGDLLKNLPIKYWSLLEFNPINRGKIHKSKFFLEHDQFDKLTKKIKVNFPNLNIKIRKYSKSNKKYCFIAPDGCIYTYIKGKGDVAMGDLKKEDINTIISRIYKQPKND